MLVMRMRGYQRGVIRVRMGVVPVQLFAATPDLVAVTGKPGRDQIKTYNFQYAQAKIVMEEHVTLNRGYITGLTDDGKRGHLNAGIIVLQRVDEQLIVQQCAA